ncbi:MAG TPA: ATP-binding protein [Vicinamibacterales bacterium]|nr:ATP-binding protein [Vicinamibacterales bacterium]
MTIPALINRDEILDPDRRLLVLTPTKRDALITRALLEPAGIPAQICPSLESLIASLAEGAAAILVAEEWIAAGSSALAEVIARQPAWSDLPVLVLARSGVDSSDVTEAVRTLGNVTLLERPLRVSTLMSAVHTAMRARERQYQIRGHLADRLRTEEALRMADRRKDEFLATLGHELRNPLVPMQAGLQLLKLGNLPDQRSVHAVEVMERLVTHLVRLVDDLLEVSRITRGLVEIRKEPLDLGTVLRTAVETSRPLVEAANQTLSVAIDTDPITVVGDPVRLTQVFANLLNNASKYTDNGGHVWLTAAIEDGCAVVSVRDDGIGIPVSQLTNVFDMFMQVDRTDRRAQGGLGIGLTLVQSLVSMHGGRVDACSAGPHTGSEFLVRLPILNEHLRPSGRADDTPQFPARRLLIVDDNRDAAETLSMLLTELGATVSVAFSGSEALAALDGSEPDAVLLDIGMPGMDGYEVCRHIRSSARHGDVMLIALTGWGQDIDRERSKRAGFDHHFVKPPDIDRLRSILAAREPRTPHISAERRG